MRILHTSDWHVGKMIRGHSRAGEHRAVLAEIVQIAQNSKVDITVVAGDLFETAAPTAESETIVYAALLDLARVAPVVVVAGNHDNARRLQALAPLLDLGRITVATEPAAPSDGGVIEIETEVGERAKIALLPFVSQRSIVKAQSLMTNQAYENSQTYTQRLSQVIKVLTDSFDETTINLVVGHAFVTGAELGGGERPAHIVDEYGLAALAFPVTANYVALGHLHKAQAVPGPTSIHYCGSPIQVDFGESEQTKQVNVVELSPGLPAKVRPVALESGSKLITLNGPLESVVATAKQLEENCWFRIILEDEPRPGLADEARSLIGSRVVDVKTAVVRKTSTGESRQLETKTHRELFELYLNETTNDTDAALKRFDELYETALNDLALASASTISKTDSLRSGLEKADQS